MDRNDEELFESSLRGAAGRHPGGCLDPALDDLGWPDALVAERRAAVSILFRVQGETLATSYGLDRLLGAGLGGTTGDGVVLPAFGTGPVPGRVSGDSLSMVGIATGAGGRSGALLAAARTETGEVVVGRVDRTSVQLRPVRGWDPELGLWQVKAEAVRFERCRTGGWGEVADRGRLALGHELVGCARAMLGLARGHALERVQFDRPIATFQALRHRLAETLVAIEGAEAVLAAAWEEPQLAAAGKALAGRAGLVAARHCQQVLAGIGFTAEHPFHRYLRRALVLDQLLGSARELTEEIGAQVLAAGRLPVKLPL